MNVNAHLINNKARRRQHRPRNSSRHHTTRNRGRGRGNYHPRPLYPNQHWNPPQNFADSYHVPFQQHQHNFQYNPYNNAQHINIPPPPKHPPEDMLTVAIFFTVFKQKSHFSFKLFNLLTLHVWVLNSWGMLLFFPQTKNNLTISAFVSVVSSNTCNISLGVFLFSNYFTCFLCRCDHFHSKSLNVILSAPN